MATGCGDVLSLADLQTAKKHQLFEAEVITGKVGGVYTGDDIDFATNQVTGQTQKTLPAVLRDAGFNPAGFTFQTGGTLTSTDRNKVVYDSVSMAWYSWAGPLPKIITAGENPVGNANWKPQTDPKLRQDLASTAVAKGANLVGFKSPLASTVARTVQDKLEGIVDAGEYGAKPVPGYDNAAAFLLIVAAAQAGVTIKFRYGVYETSAPMTFTSPAKLLGVPGTRIKLTAAGKPHVMCFDFRGADGAGWSYGAHAENFILDGNGNAVDGLSLRGVISSRFNNIRATNVTRAGLHCWWTQLNVYENFQCSKNVELFTTVPTTGILIDCEFGTGNDRGTSADTWINPEIEHVSGTGIYGPFANNCVFINGTSEGNNIGVAFGHATDVRYQSVSNTIMGMDMEVNAATDLLLTKTSYSNTFIGIMSGYSSPAIQVQGSFANKWYGGTCAGIDFNIDSHDNRVYGISLLGADSFIADKGVRNRVTDVFNISSGAPMESTDPYPTRGNNVTGANGTVLIDPYRNSLTVINATGSPINVASAAHKLDAGRMDVIIHNISGGPLTVNWSSEFRISGFTAPAAGRHRGLSLVFDSNYGYWCIAGMSTADALSV